MSASRTRPTDPHDVQSGVREQLRALTDAFALKTRIDMARRKRRVQ